MKLSDFIYLKILVWSALAITGASDLATYITLSGMTLVWMFMPFSGDHVK